MPIRTQGNTASLNIEQRLIFPNRTSWIYNKLLSFVITERISSWF